MKKIPCLHTQLFLPPIYFIYSFRLFKGIYSQKLYFEELGIEKLCRPIYYTVYVKFMVVLLFQRNKV